jgi:hypothetical protein
MTAIATPDPNEMYYVVDFDTSNIKILSMTFNSVKVEVYNAFGGIITSLTQDVYYDGNNTPTWSVSKYSSPPVFYFYLQLTSLETSQVINSEGYSLAFSIPYTLSITNGGEIKLSLDLNLDFGIGDFLFTDVFDNSNNFLYSKFTMDIKKYPFYQLNSKWYIKAEKIWTGAFYVYNIAEFDSSNSLAISDQVENTDNPVNAEPVLSHDDFKLLEDAKGHLLTVGQDILALKDNHLFNNSFFEEDTIGLQEYRDYNYGYIVPSDNLDFIEKVRYTSGTELLGNEVFIEELIGSRVK